MLFSVFIFLGVYRSFQIWAYCLIKFVKFSASIYSNIACAPFFFFSEIINWMYVDLYTWIFHLYLFIPFFLSISLSFLLSVLWIVNVLLVYFTLIVYTEFVLLGILLFNSRIYIWIFFFRLSSTEFCILEIFLLELYYFYINFHFW